MEGKGWNTKLRTKQKKKLPSDDVHAEKPIWPIQGTVIFMFVFDKSHVLAPQFSDLDVPPNNREKETKD